MNNSLFSNSIWAIAGSFISKGINFASIAFIAKILGPEMFGEYNVIQLTVGLFGTVSGLGLGLAATKLIAEWRERDIEKVGRIIGTLYTLSFIISLIVAISFFTTSKLVAIELLNNEKLTILLQITSVIVIFDAINGVQNGVLTGFESFKEIAIVSTFVGVISAPLLVAGAYYYGLVGLAVMLLLTRLLNVIVNRIYLEKKFKERKIHVRAKISKLELKNILDISIPAFLSSIATSPVNWISTSIFVNQPGGYKDIGTYNAGNQLRTLVLFLPDSAGKITIPKLANEFGDKNLKKFKKTVSVTFLLNLVLSVLPAMVLYIFGGFFQQFMGLKFNLSDDLIAIVLLTGVLIAVTNAIGYIFICSNLIWYDFLLRVFWGLALILIIVFYGKGNGAVGYGLSILFASVVHMVMQLVILMFNFKLFYNDKK
ncbi:oligosaccharide flippase family protein [Lutibacter sp.]|uniref:oligosaccharide flippase family protein n=1 Tax=Lutibacter sp. TaxID=1925666 RepID=UPI00356A14AA